MLESLMAGLAAGLVGLSTLASERWGHAVGGLLSAFPLIVGPVLFIAAERKGTAFAADAASATLLGLVALSGFALAYGRSALRWRWQWSLAVAWIVAAVLGAVAGQVEVGLLGAAAAAVLSIVAARFGLPVRGQVPDAARLPCWELPVRMALTALLIVALTAAGDRFGPTVAGGLAALPTLASVLAVFTHSRHGRDALLDLLRGMLGGMAAFVAFCAVIGGLVDRAGVAAAFVAASCAAVVVQTTAARTPAFR
jgi:hypothetical protein